MTAQTPLPNDHDKQEAVALLVLAAPLFVTACPGVADWHDSSIAYIHSLSTP